MADSEAKADDPPDKTDSNEGLFAGLHLVKSSSKDEDEKESTSTSKEAGKLATQASTEESVEDDATEHHSNLSVKRAKEEQEEAHSSPQVTAAPVTDKLLALFGPPPPVSSAAVAPTASTASTSTAAATVDDTKPAAVPTEGKGAIKSTPETNAAAEKSLSLEEKMKAAGAAAAREKEDKPPAASTTEHQNDEAFHVVTDADVEPTRAPSPTPVHPSLGGVHPDTPIPNSDQALRLLRKFASKTQPHIAVSQGGTKPASMLGYLFSSSSGKDARMEPYVALMEILHEQDTEGEAPAPTSEEGNNTDAVVDSIMGHDGDDMHKARLAVAAFCHLLSVWCHASSSHSEKSPSQKIVADYLPLAMDAANELVAHGCFDEVQIGLGRNNEEYTMIVHVICESILVADLSSEKTELAALKLLLTSGCRSTSAGDAILRGSHLLQTIRVLYHVYLTTDSEANKTTARAALQQLVTSVFKRMIFRASSDTSNASSKDDFPSENHRDAFLVLRSLCKLSMRSLQDPTGVGHSGLQTTGSSVMWDSQNGTANLPPSPRQEDRRKAPGAPKSQLPVEHPVPLVVNAVHCAHDSKILALELLLYILQNTEISGDFLRNSGPQFQYAIRNYLCVSLLKNCMSDDTNVVNLSLKLFVPLIRNFRSLLKTEIEAFVTNVFFVILDSKNSTVEHKIRVVSTFDEICSDPTALAEIFLNYDCDLSAVDLFHRIVNTLARVAKTDEAKSSSSNFVAGAGAARMEKLRNEQRELRLDAMRALRQVLASLHASIVTPLNQSLDGADADSISVASPISGGVSAPSPVDESTPTNSAAPPDGASTEGKKSLVEIYGSKKKRRQEESEAVLRFNQKPSAGIAYAASHGHIDGDNPIDVARYLLKNKDVFEKTQIGEYLGREVEYQNGFSLKVLHAYVNSLDFSGLAFDDAIRYYLSGFRLPGEAQKIDRIMEKFAERYTSQNPTVFPTADVAFILAFSIIMLNTDLHNPAIKEERRMTKEGFIRNNRGICDGKDLPEDFLNSIFDRIKSDPISLKEDDEARERAGEGKSSEGGGSSSVLAPSTFFSSHYQEMDRARESNFQKERDQIVRTTESLLRRKRHGSAVSQDQGKSHTRQRSGTHSKQKSFKFVRTVDAGLRDEYVSPMFEVTWAPALAAFSTAMESANGTVGALLAIATDDELELAAENAAETIEVCLSGCRLAICTAGLCGNDTARDAFMLALSRFSQLGTGTRLEPRHIRCTQTLLALARDDGELLGNTWEHVFRALSEIDRFHQLFHLMARNDRVAAASAERRRRRLEAREKKRVERERRKRRVEAGEVLEGESGAAEEESDSEESTESEHFSDVDDYLLDEEMDARAIDEANARAIYDAVSEATVEDVYQRSSKLSQRSIMEFVYQICRVSRMEISGYGGHVGSQANTVDLTQVHYRQQHTLLHTASHDADHPHHNQPNIYNLQKLVEVTHYNMDSRPRLVFAEIWTIVSGHLTGTALHSNAAVAMYAVDSFRQLSIQYLQREELGVFEFQRRFLKPFETVMARSDHSTTKELLLKCVERIIFMFGSETTESTSNGTTSSPHPHATLRSGWRPVLAVLGLAGRDKDEAIAKLGFDMLTGQLRQCLSVEKDEGGVDKPRAGVLLAERFVDLVDALLMYVSGPHEEMSLTAIDHLVTLSSFLADETFALPFVRKRSTSLESEKLSSGSNEELELWWPILLGLSRSIGDARKKVRLKSLVTLFGIINQHFFPTSDDDKKSTTADLPRHGDLQTLQLVFRGILTPVLEHAETDAHIGPKPALPDDFKRFMTKPPAAVAKEGRTLSWIETTFEHFMDGCIAICMRSVETFKDDSLVEEIFAMLNSCLLSDSGILAVRGLRRMEQFVTEDLESTYASDDMWATVSHMLRKCLKVRGLPPHQFVANGSHNGSRSSLHSGSESAPDNEGSAEADAEAAEAINEFIMEDRLLEDRRYIGSNVAKVITSLLSNERYATSIGMRWRLFLIGGLGHGISDWERASTILEAHSSPNEGSTPHGPPSYMENAAYGRKLINKLLLRLIAKKEVVDSSETSAVGARSAAAHALLEEQTQSLLSAFLTMEAALVDGPTKPWHESHMELLTTLVKQLVEGYDRLEDKVLFEMAWLCPILSSCIQSRNESIRLAVHELVQRVFKGTMAKGTPQTESPKEAQS